MSGAESFSGVGGGDRRPEERPAHELDWQPTLRTFDELDSTNRYLLAEALEGAPAGLAVAAEHQRAGRGRLGRRWEAPAGSSVLLSVLLRPVLDPQDLHCCSLAVALAAMRACRAVAGVAAQLKWPNDLVVADRTVGGDDRDRKLAGVLAEAAPNAPGGRPGSTAVVVGIGLNVTWPGPPEAGGTCLADELGPGARGPTPAAVRDALLGHLGSLVGRLESVGGRTRLHDELVAHCATLTRRVRVDLGTTSIVGRAEGLTPAGHLVVAEDGGARREVAVGDVVHLRPAENGPVGPR